MEANVGGYFSVPQLMTPKQVAEVLHTSEGALAVDRARQRGLPYTKVRGRVFYEVQTLLNAIEVGRQNI